jgi:hypothetical protein
MSQKIGIFGLGSIGVRIAEALHGSGNEIALAVDNDPRKVGRDLGLLWGVEELGVTVSPSLEAGEAEDCEVVLHSTSSRLETVYPQLLEILKARNSVISTCEELSYPFLRHPRLSKTLDAAARESGATVLGTGVNPGFLLDALPVFMTRTMKRVDSLVATRVVDANLRREPLQRKIGLGVSRHEFDERARAGKLGHVGLFESTALIATALGWELDEIRQEIHPVVADRDLSTEHVRINAGEVCGLRQDAFGMAGRALITIHLEMSVGPDEPRDTIQIAGEPPVDLVIRDGLHGDLATVGRAINHIDDVSEAPPGLTTVLGLPTAPLGPRPDLVLSTKLTGGGRLL